MIFKITLNKQLKSLESFILLVFLLIGTYIYIGYKNGFNELLLQYFSIAFLIIGLPALILHLEYYLMNKNSILKLDLENKFIEYAKEKSVFNLQFSNITRIIIYMAPSLHRKSSLHFLPIEAYHFAKIYSKEGDKIVITSLMIENIDDELSKIKGVEIVRKKRIFASIWLES